MCRQSMYLILIPCFLRANNVFRVRLATSYPGPGPERVGYPPAIVTPVCRYGSLDPGNADEGQPTNKNTHAGGSRPQRLGSQGFRLIMRQCYKHESRRLHVSKWVTNSFKAQYTPTQADFVQDEYDISRNSNGQVTVTIAAS